MLFNLYGKSSYSNQTSDEKLPLDFQISAGRKAIKDELGIGVIDRKEINFTTPETRQTLSR